MSIIAKLKPRVARDLRSLTKLLYSITITRQQRDEIVREAKALIKMANLAYEVRERD